MRGRRRFSLWPERFRERLLIAMVALVAGTQLVIAVAALGTVREDGLERAGQELEVARRVFTRLFERRARDLLESTRVLTADFGFKAAVASRDTPTIATALENQGARIGADLVILLDNGGQLIAATRNVDLPRDQALFPGLQQRAQRLGEATSVVVIDERVLQLVAVPVRAPLPIAWALMGFEVDEVLARELAELTSLDVSFVGVAGDGAPVAVSTLDASTLATVLGEHATLPAAPASTPAFMVDGSLLTTVVELPVAPPMAVSVLLQMSEASVFAAARRLEAQFVVILVLTLAAALVIGLALARGIARPLQRVVAVADRIRRGDYGQRVAVRSGGEIARLADAVNAMQEGIAEREARIRQQGLEDALTGLANRRFVEAALDDRLEREETFALLLVNLDGFRAVNDSLGHDVGDALLRCTADRLTASARPDTAIARIGGDEFVIVVEGADTEAALRRAAALRPALCEPVDIDGSPVAVSATIGVVASPEHGRDANRLLRRAGIALAQAREARVGVLACPTGADEAHLRELRLIRDLVGAIQAGALHVVYQPKVDVADGCVRQAEALVRWQHPELGFVSPEEFIFLAERSGQIRALTQLVIGRVLDDTVAWRAAGLTVAPCINLSAHDLADAGLAESVREALATRGLEGAGLGVEITESAVLEDESVAVANLEALRELGLEIAVDDYGTGYSALSQIRRLPITHLKVDKSFVMEIEEKEDDRVIVRSTIALGHALGLAVVAEGLETIGAWRLLDEYGCDQLQGYHIARPMELDAFVAWARAWDPSAALADVEAVA